MLQRLQYQQLVLEHMFSPPTLMVTLKKLFQRPYVGLSPPDPAQVDLTEAAFSYQLSPLEFLRKSAQPIAYQHGGTPLVRLVYLVFFMFPHRFFEI